MNGPSTPPRAVALPVLALLVVLAGCLGGGPGAGATPTAELTKPTAGTTTGTPTTTATPTPEQCTERTPAHDLTVPDRPPVLNESAARDLAVDYERRRDLARVRADHENVTVTGTRVRNVAVTGVEGGYEVRVTVTVDWSSEEVTASGGYPAAYRVTDRRFAREGRTLACWG